MDEPVSFPFDIDSFFRRCLKSKTIPKNDFEKQALLMVIVRRFEDGRIYQEKEVNEVLSHLFEDHILLRRELINFSYLQRDPAKGTYWVVKRALTESDLERNIRLRKHAEPYLKRG